MQKQKYNLSLEQKLRKQLEKQRLFDEKEKVYVTEPFTGYCDNSDHPLFTIKVDRHKSFAACYYCSKLWIYQEPKVEKPTVVKKFDVENLDPAKRSWYYDGDGTQRKK